MSEIVDIGKEVAIQADKAYKEAMEALDFGAVKLRIIVRYESIDNKSFNVPFRILIDGVIQNAELNRFEEKDTSSKVINEITLWYSAKIRRSGIQPIEIALIPIDGAEAFFEKGSAKLRLKESYTKNQMERAGKQYKVPPSKSEDGKYTPHRIPISIGIKKPLFDKNRPIPPEYQLEEEDNDRIRA